MTDACAYLLANKELKKFRYFRNLDIDFVFMTKYAVFIYPCNLYLVANLKITFCSAVSLISNMLFDTLQNLALILP